MRNLTIAQMSEISGGAWQQAVSCIGTAAGWIGSICGLALITAASPIAGVALAIFSFEANGVLTGIACGKWAAGSN